MPNIYTYRSLYLLLRERPKWNSSQRDLSIHASAKLEIYPKKCISFSWKLSLPKHCAWFVIYIRPYFPLDTLPSCIWLTSFFGGILKNYRKRKIAFMHVIKKYPISFCHLPSVFSSHAAKTFQCSFNLKIMELLVDFEIANASGLSNLIVILLMMMICAKVFQRDELRWDAIPMRCYAMTLP